ncbi:hypothetical protein BOX15_Mlig030055g1, partial [Macrostomum lignano]
VAPEQMDTVLASVLTVLQAAAFIIFPNVGGAVGSIVTGKQLKDWYLKLNKPPWTPPNWVFPPMWIFLYSCIGFASWIVFLHVGFQNVGMYLYAAQLALNWAWSPLFFGAHWVALAALDMMAMIGLSIACGIEFYQVNHVAGALIVPYLLWLSLALSINVYVYFYNDTAVLRNEKKTWHSFEKTIME